MTNNTRGFKACCPNCNRINDFEISYGEVNDDFHFTCSFCEKDYPLSVWYGNNIDNAESPIRQKAIAILEAISERLGNPYIFDNEDGNAKDDPDGTWYEFEDLVVSILSK